MDRYDRTALLRQQVLDYINEKGQARSCDVCKHFNLNVDHAYRTLRKMESQGELKAHGKASNLYFTPLKTETTSAEIMRKFAHNKIKAGHESARQTKENERKAAQAMKNKPKWLTVNNDPDRPPIRNQGGQGNLRRTVGVQSCAEWV